MNLSLAITEKPLPEDSKPVVLPSKVDVARKPKVSTNGEGAADKDGTAGPTVKRKRSQSPAPDAAEKKGKVVKDDSIMVNDSHEGAIMIDD